jgi:hypothetical protein
MNIWRQESQVFHEVGWRAYQATIAGIEAAHMIRKGQLSEENMRD